MAVMSSPHATRFAPSPTGSLHLGNARTALFSLLAARASGGRFVLRIEDTDATRNDDRSLDQVLRDLAWLGLEWDEGPDVGGPRGPYRQSERAAAHQDAVETLARNDRSYPCFCSPQELALARRTQLAAGRPPRYSGTCAALAADEVERRVAAGARPATRFRVPRGQTVEFDDAVHGPQRFASDDIGDFVIRRADGSVAFLLGNAVDDAAMDITLVLRGDDHLTNTPRQILLLHALGLREPSYGHLPLVLAPGGAPLSKRDGAASLADLREQGFLPLALCNYLVRLGHACGTDEWLDMPAMASSFDLRRTSRSAAHFDAIQLRHWQREAITRASARQVEDWFGGRIDRVPGADRAAFVAAVRGNVLSPGDVLPFVEIVTAREVAVGSDARLAIADAGRAFFLEALQAWQSSGPDFRAWVRSVGAATRTKGAALYQPLRAALTGETHGPELAPLVALMGSDRVTARLRAASEL